METTVEKDMGVLVENNFKPSEQCNKSQNGNESVMNDKQKLSKF